MWAALYQTGVRQDILLVLCRRGRLGIQHCIRREVAGLELIETHEPEKGEVVQMSSRTESPFFSR